MRVFSVQPQTAVYPVCIVSDLFCCAAFDGNSLLCVHRRKRTVYLGESDSLFLQRNTIGTLCYSVVIALSVTAVCLLVAYPGVGPMYWHGAD